MPTQHVKPDSQDVLQDIANALLKARKIVLVTGAGISTNSGIPDFRSENGLYSLIQAQFDAASQGASQSASQSRARGQLGSERPMKRRKASREASPVGLPEPSGGSDAVAPDDDDNDNDSDSDSDNDGLPCEEPSLPAPLVGDANAETGHSHDAPPPPPRDQTCYSTPLPKQPHKCTMQQQQQQQLTTSPLSSPPCEEFMVPPSSLRSYGHAHSFLHKHRRLTDVSRAVDSSPLSSPPPVLFDPFQLTSPSDGCTSRSRRSSTTASEVGEADVDADAEANALANPSVIGKVHLPNMKGKDLFDASIWADPTRTSVFYQFATSLRKKIKGAEPTGSHKFISHLRDRGKLVRCYTQNIDQIEEKVGLSTSLQDGPGSRGRFSRKVAANAGQLQKTAEEATPPHGGDAAGGDATLADKPGQSGNEASQAQQSQQEEAAESSQAGMKQGEEPPPPPPPPSVSCSQHDQVKPVPLLKREPSWSGVECVFLHGSLELLRCFQCGRVCSWDDQDRETETLSGQQPECPHCVGATEARREKGKRALGVGKLRPDIVLYGEEHPNAHLISPIVTHDLALCPDMLLILGTSLRVHGLKIMVREFAKAVHSRGGNVVFVNFTKPPESSWGDTIDYWVQWDCDAWVADLQLRIPKLWQAPEPPRPPRRKRECGGGSGGGGGGGVPEQQQLQQEEKKRPPAANPVALRDTKFTGAYCTLKIIKELHRITNHPSSSPPPPPPPPPILSSTTIASLSSTTIATIGTTLLRPLPSLLTSSSSSSASASASASAVASTLSSTPSLSSSFSSPHSPPPALRLRPPRPPPHLDHYLIPTLPTDFILGSPAADVAIPPAMDAAAAEEGTKPPKAKRSRKTSTTSAASKRPKRTSSTLNPNHGRGRKQETEGDAPAAKTVAADDAAAAMKPQTEAATEEISSILHSVKSNPRIRKRKMIDGEEVVPPTVGKRRSVTQNAGNRTPTRTELKLPPLRPERVPEPSSSLSPPPHGRLQQQQQQQQPAESSSPVTGPLVPMSVNTRAARKFSKLETFYLEDPLVKLAPHWPGPEGLQQQLEQQQQQQPQHHQQSSSSSSSNREEAEADAALVLACLKAGSPVVGRTMVAIPGTW